MTLPIHTIRKINGIKHTLASQAEWVYAAALQRQAAADDQLSVLQQEYQDAAGILRARQAAGLSGSELHEWNQWLLALNDKLQAQHVICKQAAVHVEQCRTQLVERHQDEQVWERLSERQLQALERDFRKREQAELDEAGSRTGKSV